MSSLNSEISTLEDVSNLIENALADNLPQNLKDGGVIRDGFNEELDRLRRIAGGGRELLDGIEARERERTGIKNLKIGYNRVFGYYIEVTKSFYDMVPDDYIRKQTLANAERYITPELKELESKIVGAEERLLKLEREIFASVREEVGKFIPRILASARAAAEIDMCAGFAEVAVSSSAVSWKVM